MTGKKKNKRGQNLQDARESKALKAIISAEVAAVYGCEDPDYEPEEECLEGVMLSDCEDQEEGHTTLEEFVGGRRTAARKAAAAAGGACETWRLDGDAERKRPLLIAGSACEPSDRPQSVVGRPVGRESRVGRSAGLAAA